MRKFDPWPVFFRREWSRTWPFLTGFAITGILIAKMTAGLTGRSITVSSLRFCHLLDSNLLFLFHDLQRRRLRIPNSCRSITGKAVLLVLSSPNCFAQNCSIFE
ncbi:hypothetical protein J5N97_030181 [Dioscorea zingiberensis]|uniref:Uncharacterized protein n=1 Tax=Dioscorea zingiberensis TaxID=325984 RepID=A0A9D5BX51_9LILI|nr:hypothetical protein J5N97_030181 [Dioscorea zingiberensis]